MAGARSEPPEAQSGARSQGEPGGCYETIRLAGGWRATVLVGSLRSNALGADSPCFTVEDWRKVLPTLVQRLLRPEGGQLLKYSSSGWVQQVPLAFPSGSIEAVCKHSRPKTPWRRAVFVVRGPRECQQWQRAQWLMAAGIRTARPLALLIRRVKWLWRQGFMVTEVIPQADDLFWIVHHALPRLSGRQRWQAQTRLSRALAEVFAKLYRGRLYHRDLKAPNFLVSGGLQPPAEPCIWLVDLDGLRRVLSPGVSQLLRQVARLAASLGRAASLTPAERLRFFKSMLAACGLDTGPWRSRWRQTEAIANRYTR